MNKELKSPATWAQLLVVAPLWALCCGLRWLFGKAAVGLDKLGYWLDTQKS